MEICITDTYDAYIKKTWGSLGLLYYWKLMACFEEYPCLKTMSQLGAGREQIVALGLELVLLLTH